jgi:hypothetical protein
MMPPVWEGPFYELSMRDFFLGADPSDSIGGALVALWTDPDISRPEELESQSKVLRSNPVSPFEVTQIKPEHLFGTINFSHLGESLPCASFVYEHGSRVSIDFVVPLLLLEERIELFDHENQIEAWKALAGRLAQVGRRVFRQAHFAYAVIGSEDSLADYEERVGYRDAQPTLEPVIIALDPR